MKLFMKYSIANDRQTGRRVVLWIRSAHVGERAIHLTMCFSAAAQLAQRLWVEQNARLRLLSC